MVRFTAEIIEIKAKKSGIDKIFTIKIITDQDVTELQKYIATEPVEIEVKECK